MARTSLYIHIYAHWKRIGKENTLLLVVVVWCCAMMLSSSFVHQENRIRYGTGHFNRQFSGWRDTKRLVASALSSSIQTGQFCACYWEFSLFFLVCLPKCCLLFCNGAFQNRVQLFYSSSLIFTFEFCLCWKKTLYSELCFNYLFIFQIEFLFSNTSLKNKESDK